MKTLVFQLLDNPTQHAPLFQCQVPLKQIVKLLFSHVPLWQFQMS